MRTQFSAIPVIALLCVSLSAVADYKDDIGYTRLFQEQGASTPDGTGVKVTQVESEFGDPPGYMPDKNIGQFAGKTITNAFVTNTEISSHATSIGRIFYGSLSSIAPGIKLVDVYWSSAWLQFPYLNYLANGNPKPDFTSDRIANHSWAGNTDLPADASDILRRTDWIVETDEYIQCVGQINSSAPNVPLMSGAYNVIAVGNGSGINGYGTPQLDNDYRSGRARPELVAPKLTSSGATPVVAAAAALLVELGNNNPGLSTDLAVTSTINRAGATIYNAERSEVIKAALMAGADRVTGNSTTGTDISDYRTVANQTGNGLDDRYGAGQVNIYNSFHIVAAGEQNSDEDDDTGSGTVGLPGFDYDPFFGGGGNSNTTATYRFSTGANAVVFSATLAWNIEIDGGNGSFSGSATLQDMDLALYDVSGGSQVLLQSSASTIDNTETIWTTLGAGKSYLLQVTRKGSFSWDYALAWQALNDTDSDELPDTIEVALGTDPSLADTDDDGLDDGVEIKSGTDPLLADTDGDGFDDGMEVAYGSDPLQASSTPTENVINNGDVNNDTLVDTADVLLATRILLSAFVPTAEQLVRMDMVPDSQATAGDLVRIQQLALGL